MLYVIQDVITGELLLLNAVCYKGCYYG